MRRKSLGCKVFLGVLLVPFAGFLPAATAQVVDQEQPEMDCTSVGDLTLGGPFDQRLAQVFTAGQTGFLVAVELGVECRNDEGIPAGTITLDITAAEGGMPAVVLRTTTFDAAAFPEYWPSDWPPYFRRLTLATPVPVIVGTQYALTLRLTTSTPTVCGVIAGPEGDPYPGGESWYEDIGTWGWVSAGPRNDLPFRALMQETSRISVWHQNRQWICIDRSALQGHQTHGDTVWIQGCVR